MATPESCTLHIKKKGCGAPVTFGLKLPEDYPSAEITRRDIATVGDHCRAALSMVGVGPGKGDHTYLTTMAASRYLLRTDRDGAHCFRPYFSFVGDLVWVVPGDGYSATSIDAIAAVYATSSAMSGLRAWHMLGMDKRGATTGSVAFDLFVGPMDELAVELDLPAGADVTIWVGVQLSLTLQGNGAGKVDFASDASYGVAFRGIEYGAPLPA